MFSELARRVYELTNESDNRKSLDIAIETANELIKILDPQVSNLKSGEDALDENIPINKFPNYKVESWFAQHPYFTGERVALNSYESDKVQIKFYWLGDTATKSRVSAGVMLTSNWEDSELTRNDQYKIGVDFFLSSNTKSLLMVISNNGNLRILEFNSRLSNTQQEILQKLRGVIALESKEQIHKTLWDALALSEVNKKFYQGIAEKFNELFNHLVADGKNAEDSKLFASRLLGRLLFIWFLRRKNIVQEQYGYFDVEGTDSTEYYDQKLKKLFFNTLNTPVSDRQHSDDKTPYLNGGLFEAHDNDWANQKVNFPTGFFNRLYEHLEQYNFTTDESSPEYEQIAIDPEMLGRVFESLLATQITETGDQARKAKGAFYTPREIVSYMCKESLRQHLYTRLDNENLNEGIDKLLDTSDSEWELQHTNAKRNLWGEKDRNIVPVKVMQALDELKVLDPACGSGAFPMGMLQLMLKTYERLDNRFDVYKTKLRIVQENIYGVDIEPMAVEIARLRAWLSIVVDDEDDNKVEPLPNLDFKFVCANSLLPLEQQTGLFADSSLHEKLSEVRNKFFNARVPSSKDKWKEEYYKLIGNGQNSFLDDQRESQLKSFDPFKNSQPADFFDADYMFGLPKFDLVIGNPPYISALVAKKIFSADVRSKYKEIYESAKGTYDMYLLFFERGKLLLKHDGVLCYISPTKYVSAKYAEAFRDYLGIYWLFKIADFSNVKIFANAGVSTFVSFLQNNVKRKFIVTEKYTSTARNSIEIFNTPLESLRIFPENLWGHLITGNYELLKKIYSESDILLNMAEVNGSSTASEADKFSNYVTDTSSINTMKIVNTGNIGSYVSLWGKKSYSNKRNMILQPYIQTDKIGKRRMSMYQSQKIIISKLSKDMTAMLDVNGEFVSTNTTFIYSPKMNLSLFTLAAVINSKLMNFVYKNMFSGLNLLGSFQYQAPQIRLLPIANKLLSDKNYSDTLEQYVMEIINNKTSADNKQSEIDSLIYKLYDLSPEEIATIESKSQ